MPILKDEIKEITLPVTGAKINFFSSISYGKILEFQDQKTDDEKENGLSMALFIIKSWDLTDEAGKTLGITRENIKRLPFKDGNFLMEEIGKTLGEKKTSI